MPTDLSRADLEVDRRVLACAPVDHGRRRFPGHGVTIDTCNLRPKSIGSVTLRSASPLDAPAIDPNFLGDPYDWELSIEVFKRGREILNAPSLKPPDQARAHARRRRDHRRRHS